jgi:hypothetical protein
MALTDFQEHFDNAYQETFQRALVAKSIMNTRFEEKLKYGESVERFAYDISAVRVRSTSRGSASTIDTVTDSTELLTINLEKEAAFHISDGEAKQAGPLNPGQVIGKDIALKVAIDLDARCFGEVINAAYDFDDGDLTTTASTGASFALTNTTVPQMVTRMGAKLKNKNNIDTMTNMALVVDSYAAADIEQYLLGKDIDIAGSVFKNGYAGVVRGATLYVSENLTGEVVITLSSTLSNAETFVINGITFTAVSSIGSTAGNFLIGANADASVTNLAGLINNPATTSSTQVALSEADQEVVAGKWTATASTAADTVSIVMVGSGRPVVSETATNASFTKKILHAYFGKKGAIDLVVQDMKEVDMRPTADRRGTNIFTSYLAGIKTFTDGSKKFLDVLLTA